MRKLTVAGEPVALWVRTVSALVVNAELPVKSAAELIALAKRKPGGQRMKLRT